MIRKLPLVAASAHVLISTVLLAVLLWDPGASIWVVMAMMSLDFPAGAIILWVAHPLTRANQDASGWIMFGALAGFGTLWYYCLGWVVRWGLQRYRTRSAGRSTG